MTADHLISLFEYDSDMNERMLHRLQELQEAPERMQQVFAHLVTSKKLWMMRLQGEDTVHLKVWPDLSWDECADQIAKNRRIYVTYLSNASEENLDAQIPYRTNSGDPYVSVVRDILHHVLLHSAYHRGQVAMMIRNEGVDPVVTDYIAQRRVLQ